MKAGIAGVGHLGYHHARIMKGLATETMIHDTDSERLKKVSEELGIKQAGSLEELVDWADALDVSCTTSAHYEVAMMALEKGVPVLVEKPLAATVEQGTEMVRISREKGVSLSVGHIERFNPAMAAVKDIIREPIFMEGHRMAGFSPRCTDVSVVMDLMIHDIDLVLWKARSRVSSIHASGVPVLTDTVDICNARIQFESGAVANLTASRISSEPKRKLRFFQKHGYISVDFGQGRVNALTLNDGAILPVPVEVKGYDALTAELSSFLSLVSTGKSLRLPGRRGLRPSGPPSPYRQNPNRASDISDEDHGLSGGALRRPEGSEVLSRLEGMAGEEVEAFGMGGTMLKKAGMELYRSMSDYAVMGFGEIARSIGKFLRLEADLLDLCRKRKPDIALLVDFPGFNMRLGKRLRKAGIPVVHYVAPQMWAWGGWRVGRLRRSTDLLLTLFSFEEEFFSSRGVNIVFTGHPLKDRISENTEKGDALGLLPGSRAQEVKKLLPPMIQAFQVLRDRGVAKRAMLAVSDHLSREAYQGAWDIPGLELVRGTGDVLEKSRAALVCSGTATLESSLHGVPFVVCYRTGKLNYLLARILVSGVDRIGMANIVAGQDVAPELIQHRATSENMVRELTPLFEDHAVWNNARRSLERVRTALGTGDPAGNAAKEIIRFAGGSLGS